MLEEAVHVLVPLFDLLRLDCDQASLVKSQAARHDFDLSQTVEEVEVEQTKLSRVDAKELNSVGVTLKRQLFNVTHLREPLIAPF